MRNYNRISAAEGNFYVADVYTMDSDGQYLWRTKVVPQVQHIMRMAFGSRPAGSIMGWRRYGAIYEHVNADLEGVDNA